MKTDDKIYCLVQKENSDTNRGIAHGAVGRDAIVIFATTSIHPMQQEHYDSECAPQS